MFDVIDHDHDHDHPHDRVQGNVRHRGPRRPLSRTETDRIGSELSPEWVRRFYAPKGV